MICCPTSGLASAPAVVQESNGNMSLGAQDDDVAGSGAATPIVYPELANDVQAGGEGTSGSSHYWSVHTADYHCTCQFL